MTFLPWLAALIIISQPAHTAYTIQSKKKTNESIRVLPVARTAESNTSLLRIAQPEVGALVKNNPVWIQIRSDGFSLGSDSQFERADEIAVSKLGQTVHVVIDQLPYFPVNGPAINPFNEEGYFYNTSYKFEVPFSLKEGIHTACIFFCRSFGESLKGDGVFKSTYFYIGSKTGSPVLDLSKPYLIYNEPSDQLNLTTEQPILLDFYVVNCELTPDGYQVELTIDGDVIRMISSWQPYYIYGLTKGTHTIRLQLMDGKKPSVPAMNFERTIQVY
jgi:hypothetical protein